MKNLRPALIALAAILALLLAVPTASALGGCSPDNECLEYVDIEPAGEGAGGGPCYNIITYRIFATGPDEIIVQLYCP